MSEQDANADDRTAPDDFFERLNATITRAQKSSATLGLAPPPGHTLGGAAPSPPLSDTTPPTEADPTVQAPPSETASQSGLPENAVAPLAPLESSSLIPAGMPGEDRAIALEEHHRGVGRGGPSEASRHAPRAQIARGMMSPLELKAEQDRLGITARNEAIVAAEARHPVMKLGPKGQVEINMGKKKQQLNTVIRDWYLRKKIGPDYVHAMPRLPQAQQDEYNQAIEQRVKAEWARIEGRVTNAVFSNIHGDTEDIMAGKSDVPGWNLLPESIRTHYGTKLIRGALSPSETIVSTPTKTELQHQSLLSMVFRVAPTTLLAGELKAVDDAFHARNKELRELGQTPIDAFEFLMELSFDSEKRGEALGAESTIQYLRDGGEIFSAYAHTRSLTQGGLESLGVPAWHAADYAGPIATAATAALVLAEPDPLTGFLTVVGAGLKGASKYEEIYRMEAGAKDLDRIITKEALELEGPLVVSDRLRLSNHAVWKMWDTEVSSTGGALAWATGIPLDKIPSSSAAHIQQRLKGLPEVTAKAEKMDDAVKEVQAAIVEIEINRGISLDSLKKANTEYIESAKVEGFAAGVLEVDAAKAGVDIKKLKRKRAVSWADEEVALREQRRQIMAEARSANAGATPKKKSRIKTAEKAVEDAQIDELAAKESLNRVIDQTSKQLALNLKNKKTLQAKNAALAAKRVKGSKKGKPEKLNDSVIYSINNRSKQLKKQRGEARDVLQGHKNIVREAKKELKAARLDATNVTAVLKNLKKKRAAIDKKLEVVSRYARIEHKYTAWKATKVRLTAAHRAWKKALQANKKILKTELATVIKGVNKVEAQTKAWLQVAYPKALILSATDSAHMLATSLRKMAQFIRRGESLKKAPPSGNTISGAAEGAVRGSSDGGLRIRPDILRKNLIQDFGGEGRKGIKGLGEKVVEDYIENGGELARPLRELFALPKAVAQEMSPAELSALANSIDGLRPRYRVAQLEAKGLIRAQAVKRLQEKALGSPTDSWILGAKKFLMRVGASFDHAKARAGEYNQQTLQALKAGENYLRQLQDEIVQLTADLPSHEQVGAIIKYMDSTEPIPLRHGFSMGNVGQFTNWYRFQRILTTGERSDARQLKELEDAIALVESKQGGEIGQKAEKALREKVVTIRDSNPILTAVSRMWLPSKDIDISEPKAAKLILEALRLAPKSKTWLGFTDDLRVSTKRIAGRVDAPNRAHGFGAKAMSSALAMDHSSEVFARSIGGMFTYEEASDLGKIITGDAVSVDDFVGALKSLERLGQPLTDRFVKASQKAQSKVRTLVKLSEQESGAAVFLPRAMLRELEDTAGTMIKELSARNVTAYNKEFFKQKLKDYLAIWRASITTGVMLPNPRYWMNNIFGDMSQMWLGEGIFTAARLSFQNLPTNMPYVGRYVHDSLLEMSENLKGKPVLGSVFNALWNPTLNKIWGGEAGYFITKNGRRVTNDQLRQWMIEDGILETFAQQDFLEIFTRRAEESNRVTKLWRNQNYAIASQANMVQQRQRGALYADLIQRGATREEAKKRTLDALYDWRHGMSKMEIEYLVNIMPFGRFWALAMRQMGRAVLEPLTIPTAEGLKKAALGTSKIARARKQIMLGLGAKDILFSDPRVKEWQKETAEYYESAKALVPGWLDSALTSGSHVMDPWRIDAFRRRSGAEYTHEIDVFPSLTVMDSAKMSLASAVMLVGLSAEGYARITGKPSQMAEGWEHHFMEPALGMMYPAAETVLGDTLKSVGFNTGSYSQGYWSTTRGAQAAMFAHSPLKHVMIEEDGKKLIPTAIKMITASTPFVGPQLTTYIDSAYTMNPEWDRNPLSRYIKAETGMDPTWRQATQAQMRKLGYVTSFAARKTFKMGATYGIDVEQQKKIDIRGTNEAINKMIRSYSGKDPLPEGPKAKKRSPNRKVPYKP